MLEKDIYYNLTDTQWNALQRLSSVSHMDVWFCLEHNDKGDYVIDLDNEGKKISFKSALTDLFGGMTDLDWLSLTREYKNALRELSTEVLKEDLCY